MPAGTRRALPSAVNVILNLTPEGDAAVNSAPLKNVDWISAGVSLVAAVAKPDGRMAQTRIPKMHVRMAVPARIEGMCISCQPSQ